MFAIKKILSKLTPAQLIVGYYVLAVSISTVLLSLPVALKPGVEFGFMDALFTAVSAVSVTGLTVVSLPEVYNEVGYFILMFVLQFGGIGIMTLGTFFWLIVGKKIGLKERQLIMTDQNQSNLSGLVKLLIQIIQIFVVIEMIGALVLGIYFLNYFPDGKEAFLNGLFLAVSATTNAGFDITGISMIPFKDDYFVQFITIILLTLGAIGFPVLIELKEFLSNKARTYKFHFSLFTKLTSVTFFSLIVGGTILIYLLEINGFFKGKNWHESFFYSLFMSSNTRSGGLATMNVSDFSEPTLLLLSILMFIGASPSSVGGGIRTTTLAIMILFLWNFMRGRRSIKVFKREIHPDDIRKATAVMIMGSLLCIMAVFILSITENFTLMQIIFEVCSAFGSVGLSMGITPDLSNTGKIVIMIIMFIGRVGITSLLYIIGHKEVTENFHYPKERVIIG
ncbi:TrkH family potassium uptake protein [Peribacillus frigoritolerans]|uniref:Cation transporter n=2 Tax=Bacillales TaxID=1385 RepID=A0AAN2PFG5_9BACI|nr:TrkH family potassium uptake protein [Peribacillus frigoritolerans]MCP1097161.1 TrkH family potassium uptake protein [Bacillaceae bacterium OS4b]MCP1152178.1 TrkH family potassium uptake protein [Peribacillus frigoritolerans]MCT1391627.1 TrkH family potassium uptake protein [Peribacillus frigoritolerans]CEG31597.1 cation transporter [Peribacillus simplex]